MLIKTITVGNITYDIGADYNNLDNTPNLSTVATSGSYEDLSNKPNIPTKTSDLANDSGFINKNVNDLANYTLSSDATSQLELILNSENYKLKGVLKDENGNIIYTSNEIDLPLESVVINGSYDSLTKELVLTLVNGNTIRISIADLVSGLVSQTDLNTALANYYTKNEVNGLLANKQDIVQYSTMPTASESLLGKIVQYVGTTDSTYTNGYFYKVVSDEEETPTYSWENVQVQESGGTTQNFKYIQSNYSVSNGTAFDQTFPVGDTLINTNNASYSFINGSYAFVFEMHVFKSFADAEIGEIFAYSFSGDAYGNGRTSRTLCYDVYTKTSATNFTRSKCRLIDNYLQTQEDATITGRWNFSTLPESSVTPTSNNQLTNKKYVDDSIANIDLSSIEDRLDTLENNVVTRLSALTSLEIDNIEVVEELPAQEQEGTLYLVEE